MKFAQLNFNRCSAAHDLMEKLVEEEGIDFVLGCEPNLGKGRKEICDDNCDSFLGIRGKQAVMECFQGKGFVGIELKTMIIISCYYSPNGTMEAYEEMLDAMTERIRGSRKEVLVGGDLNAKTPVFGLLASNRRGIMLEGWMATNRLVAINRGPVPTFSTSRGNSVIDVTMGTEAIAREVGFWKVEVEREMLSDHRAIIFEVGGSIASMEKGKVTRQRWRFTKGAMERFCEEIPDMFSGAEMRTAERLMGEITKKCEAHFGSQKAQ
ncbi:uncharacterized protein [Euwallacea similis]|uniref:uncharacterized protein n=1 Tax=Euwallacea similis TaxID=1736056 RepID=UPI00344EB00C